MVGIITQVAHFEWRNVSTIYNGRCRQFKFGAELETGDYMVFFLKYDQHPVDLFFFNGGRWNFSMSAALATCPTGHLLTRHLPYLKYFI